MAQRTTPDKVKKVLVDGQQYDGSSDLQAFVDTAVILVDRVKNQDSDSILTSAALERIECWLSAHFYAHAYQLRQSIGKGRSNESFQGQTGMHLESTQYGQTALDLDFSGTLMKISKGSTKATATWLGRRPSAQTDYVDRD